MFGNSVASRGRIRHPNNMNHPIGSAAGLRPLLYLVGQSRVKVKRTMTRTCADVCFSNRPGGVKRFQTIHDCGIDVTRGLVLLYGIGT